MAVALRLTGSELAKVTKARDYSAAKKAYTSLVESCNNCHTKFAEDGEPKIEP